MDDHGNGYVPGAVRSPNTRVSTYWLIQVVSWSAYAAVSVLALLPSVPLDRVPQLLLIKSTRALLGLPISHALRSLYRALMARGAGPATLGVAALVVSAVLGPAWMLATGALLSLATGTPLVIEWRSLPNHSLDLTLVLIGWSAAYLGWRHWRSAEAAGREAQQARALATRAQLDALRYQVNPHFLFNALASIRGCVLEDPSRARTMITALSDVLRHALRPDAPSLVTMDAEMRALESYLAIEQARFGERVRVAIDVPPNARRALVPAFLLHPLVENAVVHGMRTSPHVLDVRIQGSLVGDALHLLVENSGSLRGGTQAGLEPRENSGIGLRNVRERLSHAFAGAATFDLHEANGRVTAQVRIPYTAAPESRTLTGAAGA